MGGIRWQLRLMSPRKEKRGTTWCFVRVHATDGRSVAAELVTVVIWERGSEQWGKAEQGGQGGHGLRFDDSDFFFSGLRIDRNLPPTLESFSQKCPNCHSRVRIRVSRTSHLNAQQGAAGSAAPGHHPLAYPLRHLVDEREAVCDTRRDNGD